MFDQNGHRSGARKTPVFDQLSEARTLQAHIKGLKSLLELQKWQIEVMTDRLYAETPGGIAARRLLALKSFERS